jgi:hypothetical protein
MNDTDDFRAKLGSRLVFWSTIALVGLGVVIMVGSIIVAMNGKPDAVMSAAQLLIGSAMGFVRSKLSESLSTTLR